MTSPAGSTSPSASTVARAAVFTHGNPAHIGAALARLQSVARETGVELLLGPDEASKHGLEAVETADLARADIAVVLRGPPKELREWQTLAQDSYHPRRLAFAIPNAAKDLPGLLADRRSARGTVAYVCTGTECRAPITTKSELATVLAG